LVYDVPTEDLRHIHVGMTLRDYFAAKAMQGFAADPFTPGPAEVIAKVAYEWADAMLSARGTEKARGD
jgi:hypothetical protein